MKQKLWKVKTCPNWNSTLTCLLRRLCANVAFALIWTEEMCYHVKYQHLTHEQLPFLTDQKSSGKWVELTCVSYSLNLYSTVHWIFVGYFEHPKILSSGAAQLIRKPTGELCSGVWIPHRSTEVSIIKIHTQNSRAGFILIRISLKTATVWRREVLIGRNRERSH